MPTVANVTNPTSTQYMTTAEVVAHLADRGLSITTETVRRWAKRGRLPCIHTPSGQRRFRAEDVDAMFEKVSA